jgi:WD40 repeat protein
MLPSSYSTRRPYARVSGGCDIKLERDFTYVIEINDGKRLAVGYASKVIQIWSLSTFASELKIETKSAVTSLIELTNGCLCSGSYGGDIDTWDLVSGACVASLSGHAYPINDMFVLHDERLCSYSYDGTIRVWNVSTGACEHEFVFDSFASESIVSLIGENQVPLDLFLAHSVLLLMDGNILVIGSNSLDLIEIWSGTSFQRIRTLVVSKSVSSVVEIYRGIIATTHFDKKIRCWNLKDGSLYTIVHKVDAMYRLIKLKDGRLCGRGHIYNLKSGMCEQELELITTAELQLKDGSLLLISRETGVIDRWSNSSSDA